MFLSALIRFEASSLDGDTTHHEQDFGYEVIDQTAADISQMDDGDQYLEESHARQQHQQQHLSQVPDDFRRDMMRRGAEQEQEEEERFHYRGTPEMTRKIPSRSRGGGGGASAKKNRFNQEVCPPHHSQAKRVITVYF